MIFINKFVLVREQKKGDKGFMKILTIKEFLNGTECWNCKIKNNCLSYQVTKRKGIVVSNCNKKK